MKKILTAILFFLSVKSNAQLLVNLQLPETGMVQKSQLWNMTLTNTTTSIMRVGVELVISDETTGQDVLSATATVININPGTTMINATQLGAIQYNILSSSFVVDASPNGLLPVGQFLVCYGFTKYVNDEVERLNEECVSLLVQPLSPPQLVYPFDGTAIESVNPQFSWLPPSPVNLFSNLTYDLQLVEIYSTQTASEAVQQNIPLSQNQNISGSSMLYPLSATALEMDKRYAWRVIAKSEGVKVSESESWEFTIKHFAVVDSLTSSDLPFAKLTKGESPGYTIFKGALKFDYLNETSDTTWNLHVFDLSSGERQEVLLRMDTIALKAGQNLIKYPVQNHSGFLDRHMYLLELTNSRKEIWRLQFEYRKPEE